MAAFIAAMMRSPWPGAMGGLTYRFCPMGRGRCGSGFRHRAAAKGGQAGAANLCTWPIYQRMASFAGFSPARGRGPPTSNDEWLGQGLGIASCPLRPDTENPKRRPASRGACLSRQGLQILTPDERNGSSLGQGNRCGHAGGIVRAALVGAPARGAARGNGRAARYVAADLGGKSCQATGGARSARRHGAVGRVSRMAGWWCGAGGSLPPAARPFTGAP